MRFTAITLIFSLCASLVYSAALNPATLSSLAARAPDVEDSYSDVVAYALPDGHRKIDFYLDGALAGSVVETDDGGTFIVTATPHPLLPPAHAEPLESTLTVAAKFFDETGAPFDIDSLDSEPDLAKRQSRWQLAVRFAKIFARWGKRAWDFFYCISLNVSWKCGNEVRIAV